MSDLTTHSPPTLYCWTGKPDPPPRPPPDPEPEPDPPDTPTYPDPQSLGPAQNARRRRRAASGHGVILGRFMPPHLGHDYLIGAAKRQVAQLTVLVAARGGDLIEANRRVRWLRRMHPDVTVCPIDVDGLRAVDDGARYWEELTRRVVGVLVGRGVDVVFASEPTARPLAQMLSAEFVLVDPRREVVPISATEVRRDPLNHWDYLPACVRPFYVRRICLLGPEGSAKSTLSRQLAAHFTTQFVEEYARDFAGANGPELSIADFETIARQQIMVEDAARQRANRLLICDTELLSLALWCERLHGMSPCWIREAARRRPDTYYLLCAPDLPHSAQPEFGGEPARRGFFMRCKQEVEGRWPHAVVRGQGEARLQAAVSAVEKFLQRSGRTAAGLKGHASGQLAGQWRCS